ASGQSTAAAPPSGGWQHICGVLAGLEWWPSARPFGESAPVPEPAAPELSSPPPFTTETPTGAVCARLDIPAGLLVRVSTYANGGREGSGPALMVRRGSQVGTLIRCGHGTLVMGPSAAQEALDLTIFEQWIYRVWTQGHSGLKGAAVGAGTGAVLGFLIGSLK